MTSYYVGVIVPCAGIGKRFGSAVPKQYAILGTEPILVHTLRTICSISNVGSVVLAIHESDVMANHIISSITTNTQIHVVFGGGERWQSVKNALDHPSLNKCSVILVHDAVRPLATADLFQKVIHKARQHGAAVPVVPLSDTIKEVGADGSVVQTLSRSSLRAAQTPQGFQADILRKAYLNVHPDATDDAQVVELAGYTVYCTDGETTNNKITTPHDIAVAEKTLSISRSTWKKPGI